MYTFFDNLENLFSYHTCILSLRQAAVIWRQRFEELGGSAVDGCCSWVRSSFSIVWHREYANRKYLTGKHSFISIVHFLHTSQCEPHLPSHTVTESSLETALMAWLTFLCFQFDVHGGECVGVPCVHRCMLSWRSVIAAALSTPALSQGLSWTTSSHFEPGWLAKELSEPLPLLPPHNDRITGTCSQPSFLHGYWGFKLTSSSLLCYPSSWAGINCNRK